MANTRLVYPCVVHDAFGSCSYDHDGKDHDYWSRTLCWLCYGIRRFGNGHYRCVCQRWYSSDTLGTYWWFAFLDWLGGVPLPILRSSFWRTTGDRKRRDCDQARISDTSSFFRFLDDDDDNVYLQYAQWL